MIIGVDLGQRNDKTAIVAIRPAGPRPGTPFLRWEGVAAQTLPLNLSYGEMARQVAVIAKMARNAGHNPLIAADGTAVGRVFVESCRTIPELSRRLVSVTITGGSATRATGRFPDLVAPKPLLVQHLASSLEHRAINFPASMRGRDQLHAELQHFVARTRPGGKHKMEAAPGSGHDDLVCALLLAVWVGDKAAVTMQGGAYVA